MKKFILSVLSVIFCLVCMGFNAAATELNFNCSVTPQGVIKVSGRGNPGYVSVEIIRNYNENSLPGERDAVVIDAAATDENGDFSFEWSLPPGEQSQYYMVVIGNTGSYKEESESRRSIYFATEEDVNSVINLINQCETADELRENVFSLKAKTDIIQISDILTKDTYEKYEEEILTNIISQRGEAFGSFEDFRSAFDKAMGISEFIRISEDSLDLFVMNYGEALGLDTEEYNSSSALKAAMARCAANVIKEFGLISPDKADEVFLRIEAVAAVNIADRGDVISIIQKYNSVFGIDTSSLSTDKANSIARAICVTDVSKEYASVMSVKSAYSTAMSSNGQTNAGYVGGGAFTSPSGTGIGTAAKAEIAVPENSTPQENNSVFNDLGTVPWAEEYILRLARAKIVNGKEDGVFDPDSPVTREEFTKMLALALELPGTEKEAEFSDLNINEWYMPYINSVVAAGLINGHGDGTFGISQPITREEAVTLIARAAEYSDYAVSYDVQLPFEDVKEISEFAIDAVKACYLMEIVSGDDQNQFLPLNSITRAECAKIICCLIELL